jgi:ABC-type amino acid transport substrate-binding protein
MIAKRWRVGLVNLGVIVALLVAVSYLPPDTSLRDVQRTGSLKVCVPPLFPPLVTGDAAQPGFDVELVRKIAERLNLKLSISEQPLMGQDFNPRNWILTRAQCDLIAGALADTVQNRGFLQMLPTDVETGWVALSRDGALPAAGASVGVLAQSSGLGRVALSSWLRAKGLRAVRAATAQALLEAVANGNVEIGISERFALARLDPEAVGLREDWLTDESFAHNKMALGMWKGEQTLWRAVAGAVDALRAGGELEQLRERYGLAGTLEGTLRP